MADKTCPHFGQEVPDEFDCTDCPVAEKCYRAWEQTTDEFIALLSMGNGESEAAAILDADILDFESWTEMYGDEISNEEVISTLVI